MERFFSNKPLPKTPRDDSESPPPLPPRHMSLQITATPKQLMSGAKRTVGILDKIGAFENKSSGSANYQPISFVKPQIPSGKKPKPPPKGIINDYRNKPVTIGLNITPTVVKPSSGPPALPAKPVVEKQVAHIAPTVVAPSSTRSIVSSLKEQLKNSGISDNKQFRQNHQPTVVRPESSNETYSTLSFQHSRHSNFSNKSDSTSPTVIRPEASRTSSERRKGWERSPSDGHTRPAPPPPNVVKPRISAGASSQDVSHVRSLRGQLEGKLNLGQRPPSIVRPDHFHTEDSESAYDSLSRRENPSDYDTFTAPSRNGKSRHAADDSTGGYATVKKKGPAPARPPPPKKTPSPTRQTSRGGREPFAIVLYEFEGSHEDELSSTIGDVILLKREVDEDWTYGKNKRTGLHGIIPLNFLDVKLPLADGTPLSTPSPTNQHSGAIL